MNSYDERSDRISSEELADLCKVLSPLVGIQLPVLRLPKVILKSFEPSQVGTIVGTLLDACIPELHNILENDEALKNLGLEKHEGILGDREGYPDFRHVSGKRLELKLLYVDPVEIDMKKPPTPREPSARLTQKVTLKNVDPKSDALMILSYQLQSTPEDKEICSPTIIDVGIFSMIDCVEARDHRLKESGGLWFGEYETPCILSKIGKGKEENGISTDTSTYGRKESEGKDYNEDTNFGKLKRIPYKPLQLFLKKHGANYTSNGTWPANWKIEKNM